MAETIHITADRSQTREVYRELLEQVKALLGSERDEIACLANVSAALAEVFGHHWIGFYLVRGEELVLGPFQGPVACTRISFGKGVCGTAWKGKTTQRVDDVDLFPGHIACSALSKSEIVVPVFDASGRVKAVLDIDSSEYARFQPADQDGLEALCAFLTSHLYL